MDSYTIARGMIEEKGTGKYLRLKKTGGQKMAS